jgi:hypothetical protein
MILERRRLVEPVMEAGRRPAMAVNRTWKER